MAGGTFEGIRSHQDDVMARGPPASFLPRSDQKNPGRVSPERTAGGGILPGLQPQSSDRKFLPQGVRRHQVGAESLAGEEGRLMVGFGGHLGRGGASAPADCIHGPEEVPSAGLVLHAMRHPGHRYGLPGGGGYALGHISSVPLSGGHIIDPWEGDHQSDVQTGRDYSPRPN